MMLPRSTRRSLLRGAGVSLALPLFARDAVANQPERPIRRMVCVANPLGFVADNFFPKSAGPLADLPPLLQPLAGLKRDFSVFSNLDHGVSGGHQAVHSLLSGIRDNESSQWATRNVTVDQMAAQSVGSQTRFPSIVAAVGDISGELECRTSWTAAGVNVPPVTSPETLFRALFVADTDDQIRRRREAMTVHASILDAIGEQAAGLHRELGSVDRQKLDEYLTSVRSVERRLEMSRDWIGRPKPTVELGRPDDAAAFTKRLPLYYEMLRLALATDSTRVATLSIPGNLPVMDLGLQGNYHAFSHHGKVPRMLDQLMVIEKFQMRALADFLQSLRDTPMPGGETLLDSTMVLAGSGMGNASSHSNKNLPILLAGGGFEHGQHHVLPEADGRRVPLCNLYTSMLQQFSGGEAVPFNKATGTLDSMKVTG